jgi:outer membrane protein OmpA-like peptidoglycan-associated protein
MKVISHMNKKIILLAIFFLCACLSEIHAVTLSWDIPKDDRLELVKTAEIRAYLNKHLVKVYEERNIIDLTCYERNEDSMSVKGVFSVFSRDSGTRLFKPQKKEFSDFTISHGGRYGIPKEYLMPNLRHIPTFPSKDISEGETWNAPAVLVFDHLDPPLYSQFSVNYVLKQIMKKDGEDIAVITYDFAFEEKVQGKRGASDYPVALGAKNNGLIYWNIAAHKPVDGSDSYRVGFLYPDGSFGEFNMIIASQYKIYQAVKEADKNKAREELKKDLEDKKGITVEPDDRGIALRMGEVLFAFDSAKLRDDTKKTLDSVIDILKKKYPDREIIVEGHTDSIGDRKYNQGLSDRRAESVAEYLKKGVGHDKLSYKGYGADKPISDNATKEGQAKNRRVEIIIKLK